MEIFIGIVAALSIFGFAFGLSAFLHAREARKLALGAWGKVADGLQYTVSISGQDSQMTAEQVWDHIREHIEYDFARDVR